MQIIIIIVIIIVGVNTISLHYICVEYFAFYLLNVCFRRPKLLIDYFLTINRLTSR